MTFGWRLLLSGCSVIIVSLAWAQKAPDAAADTSIVILENSRIVTSASGDGAVAATHIGSHSVRAHGDGTRDVRIVIEGSGDGSEVPRCSWDLGTGDVVNADWSGCDLAGADLTGRRLVNVDLHDANLEGADLSRAVLVNVNLRGANLNGVRLDGVSLINTRLDAAGPAVMEPERAD